MQPGRVSIMMPAYNAERYIGQAIASVLAQSYSTWELLVVDDGSTDGTAQIIAQFSDPRIRVFQQTNQGEAVARNRALEQMQGEFVAFLDADDLYLPNHLLATLNYLQSHPEYDGVYTDGFYCNEKGTRLQTLSSRRIGPYEGRVFEEVVRASCVFGPPLCVVLRAAPIVRHRLAFDPDITIGPDWDFFIRYADSAQFGYVDQHTCLYRLHHTNISVQTNFQRRALDLAKCRIKAIHMQNFKSCSPETRTAVFYDLLISLLKGFPERQSAITHWPQFNALPPDQQARLLRLMASKALANEETHPAIEEWLHRSRTLHPADKRGLLFALLYTLNPWLCRLLLRVKTMNQRDPLQVSPFADIQLSH